MGVSVELGSLLGPRGLALLAWIGDTATRDRVVAALEVCVETLRAVDGLDVNEAELVDPGLSDGNVWKAVGPDVRRVVITLRDAAIKLSRLFPPSADGDHKSGPELDLNALSGDVVGVDALEPLRDRRAVEIDELVQTASAAGKAQVGVAILTLLTMLKQDFSVFSRRWRSPRVVGDRWMMLEELQDFRCKCSKCMEAVAAVVIHTCGSAGLDALLPRYDSEAGRASALRAAIVDLAYDVSQYEQALCEGARGELDVVRIGLSESLDAFSGLSAYRHMRAVDRREFILMRAFLREVWLEESELQTLRDRVVVFHRFLEGMRGINQRFELVLHDRRHLEASRLVLESGLGVDAAVPFLDQVYGREPGLDAWIRAFRYNHSPSEETLPSLVNNALESLPKPVAPLKATWVPPVP